MEEPIKCQINICENDATTELQIKTDGLTPFLKGDPSRNGKPYVLKATMRCGEHAQECRKKYLIESEIGL